MPIVSLVKTFPPVHLDRTMALDIDCEKLYIQAAQRAGTQDVQIVVQPGETLQSGAWLGGVDIRVPRMPIKLGILFPEHYQECVVKSRYTYGASGLDPSTLMTRQQFVMETLDIWERLLTGMKSSYRPTGEENHVVSAMETLKSTYTFQELMPEGFDMDKFKALFEPDREDASGNSNV